MSGQYDREGLSFVYSNCKKCKNTDYFNHLNYREISGRGGKLRDTFMYLEQTLELREMCY